MVRRGTAARAGLIQPRVRKRGGDAIAASAALLHRISLRVTGTCEHQQAQVRRGGIPFSSIDADTLAVAKRLHLRLIGEALIKMRLRRLNSGLAFRSG